MRPCRSSGDASVKRSHFIPQVSLGDVATVERTIVDPADIKSGTLYAGLEHIDGCTGKVSPIPVASGFLASTKHMFTAQHVLYGKLRPYLGKIACPDFTGVCSTDILPILPSRNLDRRYLYHFLRQPSMVDWVASHARGANLPRIRSADIEAIEISLPPLPEQRRIAAILEKADSIRRKRREVLRLTDEFLLSGFFELFEQHIANDTSSRFGDLLREPLINGFFAKNDEYDTGTPVVWVDNLYHTISIATEGLRRARLSEEDMSRYEVREGDLLFTRSSLVAEGVGQINIVPALKERTAFECHIIRARVDRNKLNPYYVLGLYRSSFGRKNIHRNANTATMTTINQSALGRLPCPVPPLELQDQYERIVRQTERTRSALEQALASDEQLMRSLTQRAFRGDL